MTSLIGDYPCRKKSKDKENKASKPLEASCTEMPSVLRAFSISAITGIRVGYVSLGDFTNHVNHDKTGLTMLQKCVNQRTEDFSIQLWD